MEASLEAAVAAAIALSTHQLGQWRAIVERSLVVLDDFSQRVLTSTSSRGATAELALALAEAIESRRQEAGSLFDEQHRALENVNIVLFGRTGAGKSTLIEALTRGNGSTVSHGDSDWTTDIRAVNWRGCRLVDTPGVAGWGRTVSVQDLLDRTRAEVRIADLVILCFDEQNQQVGEFAAIAEWVKEYGKPVLSVLNMRSRHWRVSSEVSSAARRRRMSQAVRGHVAHITDQLEDIGLYGVPVVALSSQRALHSRATLPFDGPDPEAPLRDRELYGVRNLLQWSNFSTLEGVLIRTLTDGALELRTGMLHAHISGLVQQLVTTVADVTDMMQERITELDSRIEQILNVTGYPESFSTTRRLLSRSPDGDDILTWVERMRSSRYSAGTTGIIHSRSALSTSQLHAALTKEISLALPARNCPLLPPPAYSDTPENYLETARAVLLAEPVEHLGTSLLVLSAGVEAHEELTKLLAQLPVPPPAQDILEQAASALARERSPQRHDALRRYLLGEDWIYDPTGLHEPEQVVADTVSLATNDVSLPAFLSGDSTALKSGAASAWLSETLHDLRDDSDAGDVLDELAEIANYGTPLVHVLGTSGSGKTSFARRLLLDQGDELEEELEVQRGRSTHKVRGYDWEGFLLVDTPGLGTDVSHDEEATFRVYPDASLVLYVISPNILLPDISALATVLAGDQKRGLAPKADRTLLLINRMDTLGVDPAESRVDYERLCRNKRRELQSALAARKVHFPLDRIVCIAADPYQLIGDSRTTNSFISDEALDEALEAAREWDGITYLETTLFHMTTQARQSGLDRSLLEGGLSRLNVLAGKRQQQVAELAEPLQILRSVHSQLLEALAQAKISMDQQSWAEAHLAQVARAVQNTAFRAAFARKVALPVLDDNPGSPYIVADSLKLLAENIDSRIRELTRHVTTYEGRQARYYKHMDRAWRLLGLTEGHR